MTDRELLEKAAKAAGYKVYDWLPNLGFAIDVPWKHGLSNVDRWNPLTDDGDALRLAVKLHFVIDTGAISTSVHANNGVRDLGYEFHDSDPYAATRRAIVRAAAAIGEKT